MEVKTDMRKDELTTLYELTRKELVADLIFDELYKGIQLNDEDKPDFNSYKLKDEYLLELLKKYNTTAYENRLIELADERAKRLAKEKIKDERM